jgi:hypothetical protein
MTANGRILIGSGQAGGATALGPIAQIARSTFRIDALAQPPADGVLADFDVGFDIAPEDVDDDAVCDALRHAAAQVVMTGLVGPIETGLDYRLFRAARRCGIPVVSVLDSWANLASRWQDHRGGCAYVPDRLAVMDERSARACVAGGMPQSVVAVTGHPLVQLLRALHDRSTDDVEPRNEILFISEPLRWCMRTGRISAAPADEGTVLAMIEAALPPGCNVIVKEHPRHPSVFADRTERTLWNGGLFDTLDRFRQVRAIVGIGSPMLLWGLLLGVPVVAVRADRDGGPLPFVPVACTTSQLAAALNTPLDRRLVERARVALGWANEPASRIVELVAEVHTQFLLGSS